MSFIRPLCEWLGFPKEFISKILDRKYPQMTDAVIEGNIAKVEEYREQLFPIAGENENILHIALQHKQYEMAVHILDNFKDIRLEDKNSDGDTPLMIATFHNHIELITRLVAMNAPLNSREREGATPFMAAAANGSLEVL